MQPEIQVEPPRTAQPPPPPPPPSPTPIAPASAPKIIYTAEARAKVVQLDTALARITQMVERSGGYLSSQHRTNSNYRHEAELTIRLPAGTLNGALEYLPSIAEKIDYQNLDSRDVTAQWTDLEIRLQTKRDVRQRYIDILRNKAVKVSDILDAESKIRVVTEEIESREGQLRVLRDRVSYSTLTLTLYETKEFEETGESTSYGFGSRMVRAFGDSVYLMSELVVGVVTVWPLLLIGFFLIWLLRRWWRNRAAGGY